MKCKYNTELALLTIFLLMVSNAFADTKGAADFGSSDSQCRATYAVDDGTLKVPCVKVLNPTEGPPFYTAELQQIAETEPLQFSVTRTVENNDENQEDSCVATYSAESGEVYLPCVDMVDPSGEIESNELIFQTISTDSFSSLQLVLDNASLDEAFRTRRTIRGSSIPEATTGFTWPLPYNFSNNGGYQFEDFSTLGGSVYHPAQDWNVPNSPGGSGDGDKGLDVVAVANGKVVDVNHKSWGGLVIQHNYKGETWYSQYGHVQNIVVSENQIVTKGQKMAEIGKVTEFNNVDYAHLHFEIREADHPNPTHGPYWSGLKNLSDVRDWYEDPGIFIPAHSAYELLSLNSNIQLTPSPLVQNSPASVQVRIANTGGTYQGQISAAVYRISGQPVNDVAPPKQVTIEKGKVNSYTFYNQVLSFLPGTYILQIEYETGEGNWKPIPKGNYTNPITITVQPRSIPSTDSSYTWHGNGSIISYHGSLLPSYAGEDWPFGITRDVVQLHASSGKPVGFFQWQINENGCKKLKLEANLPYNEVDITLGPWNNRNDDITFSKVKLPFVLGESNTGYRFDMDNGKWYVVKVALRNGLSQNVKLNASCTYDTPTSAIYQRGGGDAIMMEGGYQWHGNASVISHMFRNFYSKRNQTSLSIEWPYGAFQDVTLVHPSSAKPMVFFQWQRDSVCSRLTLDSDLSSYEKRVDIHVKSWAASPDAAMVHSNKTLPYTIYDNGNDGSWSVIQIKFRNPVGKTARVTAKCPGT